MPQADPDRALCRQLAAGDASACRQLVARYHRLVYSLAYRLLGDPQEAEDLAQEVFMQVYLRASEFRGESKLSTWIYRITYHLGLNHRRDLKRERTELVAARPEAGDAPPEAHAASGVDVFAALGALPVHDQTILTLHYVHEQSIAEIGGILELSTSAVKVRLFRARERLRAIAGADPDAPDARAAKKEEP